MDCPRELFPERQRYERLLVAARERLGGLIGIGLPGEDHEEELAGFITANWDEVKSRIDNL